MRSGPTIALAAILPSASAGTGASRTTRGIWAMGEVVITIGGMQFCLYLAIDADRGVLEILVQQRRNAKATKRFFYRLVTQFGSPGVVVMDKLGSLRQAHTSQRAGCQSSGAQRPKQQNWKFTPSNPKARKDHGTIRTAS